MVVDCGRQPLQCTQSDAANGSRRAPTRDIVLHLVNAVMRPARVITSKYDGMINSPDSCQPEAIIDECNHKTLCSDRSA